MAFKKRGIAYLTEKIISIILAVIVVFLLIYFLVYYWHTTTENQEKLQAKGQLSEIIEKLRNLEKPQYLFLYAPRGWYLVSFKRESNFNNDIKKPITCYDKNCICICKKTGFIFKKINCNEKGICENIEKPLEMDNKLVNIEIKPMDLWLVLSEDSNSYLIKNKNEIFIDLEMRNEEKEEIKKLREILENQPYFSKLRKLSEGLPEKYYITESIIILTSKVNSEFVSCDGKAGLIPLTEEEARNYGLKVPEYGKKVIECDGILRERTICNKATPENCNSNDERFNPEKNLVAGINLLKDLGKKFSQNGNPSLLILITAYHDGSEIIEKLCPEWDYNKCKISEQTKEYVSKILSCYAYLKNLDNKNV